MMEMLSSRKVRTRILSELSCKLGVTGNHSLLDIEDKEIFCQQGLNISDEVIASKVCDEEGLEVKANRQAVLDRNKKRLLDFKEAAIYLEEGADFDPPHPPWDRSVLTVLLLLHRKWLYAMDLLASVCLLLLGFTEAPCHPSLEAPLAVHIGVEIGCLMVSLVVVLLKIRTRWSTVWGARRDLSKCFLIGIFMVEAVVIVLRGKPHWRLSRSLRPVILIENHYMTGIRRFLRQLIESLPPILDIMGLMMFMITIYSVLGFYLLGPTQHSSGSPYFQSFTDSLVNLFVLLTTANFPDIMMPSYNENMAYTLFFISYLSINLYFLMNLMLTVVYKTFADVEEKKFSALIDGKADAASKAFDLLKNEESEQMEVSSFRGLMREYQPLKGDIDTLLMWKFLTRRSDNPDKISRKEFGQVYQAISYRWSVVDGKEEEITCWYKGPSKVMVTLVTFLSWLVNTKGFEFTVYSLVGLNTALLVIQAALIQTTDQDHIVYNPHVGMGFMLLYGAEVLLKLFGMGLRGYLSCPWNIFDFLVTTTSFISMVMIFSFDLEEHMSTIVVLRLVRVLRLFRMKKRFRDVFGTAVILLPHLVSTVIVLLLLYYFFAIIGLELFSSYNLLNCCKGTAIEPFYFHHPDPQSVLHGFYYMNNFHSLPEAGITLFELTVVNNWSIIMEAYVMVTGTNWTRLFFIIFYLFTIVVLTLVVAAILEAFLFRIQYKKKLKKEDETGQLSISVTLSSEEVSRLPQTLVSRMMSKAKYSLPKLEPGTDTKILFRGDKRRSREEMQHLLQPEVHGAGAGGQGLVHVLTI